jgi:hypothetical protein
VVLVLRTFIQAQVRQPTVNRDGNPNRKILVTPVPFPHNTPVYAGAVPT